MFEHQLDFILGKECQRHDLSKVLIPATVVIILLLESELLNLKKKEKVISMYTIFYKNILYKNIKAEIVDILTTF